MQTIESARRIGWGLVLCCFAGSGTGVAGEKRPINLLFLMTDQHHAAAMGCAGSAVVQTPNLDRLAHGGVRFANSFCVVPYCSPTRLALVTGRYPSGLGLGRNIDGECTQKDPLRLRETGETYMHRLAAAGYHCHHLGKWHIGDPAELSCYPTAEDDREAVKRTLTQRNQAAGKNKFDDVARPGETERVNNVWMQTPVAEAHRRFLQESRGVKQDIGVFGRQVLKGEFSYESVMTDYCIELLRRHRHEPFAITWSVSPPHAPIIAPSPYYDLYDPAKLPLPATWNDHPVAWKSNLSARMGALFGEAGVRESLRCYYANVTRMDEYLGRILNTLDELGLADHTLVIYTSDHGTMLGQHGMIEKATGAMYDDLMRVPLVMRLPQVVAGGKTCEAGASSVDLASTILDYLSLPPLAKAEGRSLRPLVDGAADDARPIFGERGDVQKPGCGRMIRTRQWKLCLYPTTRVTEQFDLQKDPEEVHNLAGDPSLAPQIAKLKAELLDHMRAISDPAQAEFTAHED